MNLAIVTLGILVVLEVLCRLVFPKPKSWPKPQVRNKMDRTFGYVMRPSQTCYSMEAKVTINSLGFRGKEPTSDYDSKDLRVLVLGNSLTFGAGMDDDSTYPSQLERMLRERYPGRVAVINAGTPAFQIRQYIAFLEKKLTDLRPNLVILGMGWIDLHHYPRLGQKEGKVDQETWEGIRKRFEQKDSQKTAPKTADAKFKDLIRHWRFLYVVNYYFNLCKAHLRPKHHLRWGKGMFKGELDEQITERLRFSEEKLPYLAQLCEHADAKFLVTFFPDYRQIFKHYPRSVWPSALIRTCNEARIPNMDFLPVLRDAHSQLGQKLFVPYDLFHYSVKGNKVIAKAIYDEILNQGLLEQSLNTNLRASNSPRMDLSHE